MKKFVRKLQNRISKENNVEIKRIDKDKDVIKIIFFSMEKTLTIRLHRMYFKGFYPSDLSNIIYEIKTKVSPLKLTNWNKVTSFLHIEDALDSIIKIVKTKEAWGLSFDIASEEYIKLESVYELLFEFYKWRPASIEKEMIFGQTPKSVLDRIDCSAYHEMAGISNRILLKDGIEL